MEAQVASTPTPSRINTKVQVLEGSPDFAYLVADRVTDPYQAKDCTILIIGRKRSGKSTQAIALAEEIAEDIACIKGENDPSLYFDVEECVISVERMGGLDLFTSERATRNNQVFVIDDAKINISNRKFASPENQIQNELVTIFGPFKHVLIFTSVFKRSIDKDSRELADFIVKIDGSNPYTKQTYGQVFFYETNDAGDEYKKFLQWVDPKTGVLYRLNRWIGTLPTPDNLRKYNNMRRSNSVKLIEEARETVMQMKKAKLEPQMKPSDVRAEWVKTNKVHVQSLRDKGYSIRKISRELNKPPTTIEKCFGGS
jgi:hypothetical protein